MSELYSAYFSRLKSLYSTPQFKFYQLSEHHGFAMAAKYALEKTTTKYAILCQHDRTFKLYIGPRHLQEIIGVMEKTDHVRYIGFPTKASVRHAEQLQCNKALSVLGNKSRRIEVLPNSYLQPLTFWYDSQHLCHVQRYLEIFSPFIKMPTELKSIIGLKSVKAMKMRKGDFIEDKFGQAQHKVLQTFDTIDTLNLMFKWFGSYLYIVEDIVKDENDLKSPVAKEPCLQRLVFIGHLKGRWKKDYEEYVSKYYSVFCRNSFDRLIRQCDNKQV